MDGYTETRDTTPMHDELAGVRKTLAGGETADVRLTMLNALDSLKATIDECADLSSHLLVKLDPMLFREEEKTESKDVDPRDVYGNLPDLQQSVWYKMDQMRRINATLRTLIDRIDL